MRKLTALGLMTLTLTSMIPLTANAAVRCNIPSFGGRNVVSINGYCNSDDLKAKLQQLGINGYYTNINDINEYLNNCRNQGQENNGNNNNGNNNNGNNNNGNNGNNNGNNNNGNNGNNNNGNSGNNNNNNGGSNNNGNNGSDNTSNKTYTQQVVDLVNTERAKEGLAPLTIDPSVEKAATVRANEIQSKFDHTRPNGSSFSSALKEQGVNYRGAGENIAWGQRTPEEVVTAWMNSAGHRANIMNKSFTHIGVGNTQNGSGTQYWVQLFTY